MRNNILMFANALGRNYKAKMSFKCYEEISYKYVLPERIRYP